MPEIQPCNPNPNSASERHALHPLRRLACPGRPACRLLASKPPRNPGHRLACHMENPARRQRHTRAGAPVRRRGLQRSAPQPLISRLAGRAPRASHSLAARSRFAHARHTLAPTTPARQRLGSAGPAGMAGRHRLRPRIARASPPARRASRPLAGRAGGAAWLRAFGGAWRFQPPAGPSAPAPGLAAPRRPCAQALVFLRAAP